jgi:hypothetical protein
MEIENYQCLGSLAVRRWSGQSAVVMVTRLVKVKTLLYR